jgi:glycerol-3-phosphate dehydrogenase
VDDSRLVVLNALDAAERGASILTRRRVVAIAAEAAGWQVVVENPESGARETLRARALVNATGAWVNSLLQLAGIAPRQRLRLVKGSHLILKQQFVGEHAYLLQSADRRVIFAIPWEGRYTLVGTTDMSFDGDPARVLINPAETTYLLQILNRFLRRHASEADIVGSYAGVRPLYDDGSEDPSAITRDYTLRVDDADGAAPVLSVFGGKITTYRRLAEHALEKLAPYFPALNPAWTGKAPLPGSDFADREAAKREFFQRYPDVAPNVLQGVFRRHGVLGAQVLGDGRLGEYYGAGLTERELGYLMEKEWARTAEDVLWRRTKCGLRMSAEQRKRVAQVAGR